MNRLFARVLFVSAFCLCLATAAAPKKPAGNKGKGSSSTVTEEVTITETETTIIETISEKQGPKKPAGASGKTPTKPSAASKKFELATPMGCGCAFVDPKQKCKPLDTSLGEDGFRVKGGTQVKGAGSYPYQALVKSKDNKNPNEFGQCGGTLISDEFVLTAAHCIYEEKSKVFTEPFEVILGARDLNKLEEKMFNGVTVKQHIFGVKSYAPHENYNSVKETGPDIALIRLDRKAPVAWNVRPACLPDATFIHYDKKPSTFRFKVSGWGKMEFGDAHSAVEILREAPIKPAPEKVCKERYGSFIDKTYVCAGGDGKDSCQGDSGGPLVEELTDEGGNPKYYVVGVVAAGDGCGQKGVPGYYMRVSEFLKWITETASVM